jgi:predicted nucleic acid-binding protein
VKYLIDTNVFREIGKTSPNRNVDAWLVSIDDRDLAVSALTVRETANGIARLRASKPDVASAIERRVEAAFDAFGERILPVTREIAALWGEPLSESEKHIEDTGLAATARVHGLILVTRNLAHVAGRSVMALDPYKPNARAESI